MSQTQNQQAYQRGIRIARMWKRLKGTILRWDMFCVSKARKHKLPGWIGHVPIAVAFLGSAAAALFGGFIIAGSLLFIWAFAFILQHVGQENTQINDSDYFDSSINSGALTEYRDGDQGYGLYCGAYRVDLDDE